MDTTFRPENAADFHRQRANPARVRATAVKCDEVADWKPWVQTLGIRLLGLRNWAVNMCSKVFFGCGYFHFSFSNKFSMVFLPSPQCISFFVCNEVVCV